MLFAADEEARAQARKGPPPPPKEGKVFAGSHFVWFHHQGFSRMTSGNALVQSWRAKVDLAPGPALERATAWAQVQPRIDALRAKGCEVIAVHAYGYEIPNTSACEAQWWLDVLVPPGFNPIAAGLAGRW